MTCNKCKASWAFGPSDICPICHGVVTESIEEAKKRNPNPILLSQSGWDFKPPK